MRKIKFRHVRGSLYDSMQTVVELEATKSSLFNYLSKFLSDNFLSKCTSTEHTFTKDSIELEYECKDERNGWDTYLISVNGCAVGYTDGIVDDNIKRG